MAPPLARMLTLIGLSASIVFSLLLVADGFVRFGSLGFTASLSAWSFAMVAWLVGFALSRSRAARWLSTVAAALLLTLTYTYLVVLAGNLRGVNAQLPDIGLLGLLLAGPVVLALAVTVPRSKEWVGMLAVGLGLTLWAPIGLLTTVQPFGYAVTSLVTFGLVAWGASLLLPRKVSTIPQPAA